MSAVLLVVLHPVRVLPMSVCVRVRLVTMTMVRACIALVTVELVVTEKVVVVVVVFFGGSGRDRSYLCGVHGWLSLVACASFLRQIVFGQSLLRVCSLSWPGLFRSILVTTARSVLTQVLRLTSPPFGPRPRTLSLLGLAGCCRELWVVLRAVQVR